MASPRLPFCGSSGCLHSRPICFGQFSRGGVEGSRRFYADGSITGAGSVESSNQTAKKLATNNLDMIVKEIGGSDFVVFVDDFHYIEPGVREEIGR